MSSNYELDSKSTRMRSHSVHLDNQKKANISGVLDVESFNDQEVVMVIEPGLLTIIGENLHISKLNLEDGQLIVEGLIFSLDYSDTQNEQKQGFFSKMFR